MIMRSKTRKDVTAFAEAMESVLKEHDDRQGWENEHYDYLIDRLYDEIVELKKAIRKRNSNSVLHDNDIMHELVDVANFCMMLYCNYERIRRKFNKRKNNNDG